MRQEQKGAEAAATGRSPEGLTTKLQARKSVAYVDCGSFVDEHISAIASGAHEEISP